MVRGAAGRTGEAIARRRFGGVAELGMRAAVAGELEDRQPASEFDRDRFLNGTNSLSNVVYPVAADNAGPLATSSRFRFTGPADCGTP